MVKEILQGVNGHWRGSWRSRGKSVVFSLRVLSSKEQEAFTIALLMCIN
jgi:hypothetical protein